MRYRLEIRLVDDDSGKTIEGVRSHDFAPHTSGRGLWTIGTRTLCSLLETLNVDLQWAVAVEDRKRCE